MSKLQQSRGASPGGTFGGSSGAQPARASSAPRVSGLASASSHHHATTPPGSSGSTVRTASQPMQASGGYGHPRGVPSRNTVGGGPNHGHHHGSPGSPGPLSSPPVASTATPAVPGQHYHGAHGHPSPAMFPASPAVGRGASPSPTQNPAAMALVSGAMAINTGRGTIGSAGGLQRNMSPMSQGGPASPAGNVPPGQMPFGGASSPAGQRPDLLSTTRGRSPPPTHIGGPGSSGPASVRAPRAATPSALVKGIAQGMHGGNTMRNSFGGAQMVVHRGGMWSG